MSSDNPTSGDIQELPILPLRDVVVYPHMVIPLFVGRERSKVALDQAMKYGKQVVLVAQKQADTDDPGVDDVYRVGTIANILQLVKMPDGTDKVLAEGRERALISDLSIGEFYSGRIETLYEHGPASDREVSVLSRSVISQFEQYVKLNKKVPPEILTSLSGIDDVGRDRVRQTADVVDSEE